MISDVTSAYSYAYRPLLEVLSSMEVFKDNEITLKITENSESFVRRFRISRTRTDYAGNPTLDDLIYFNIAPWKSCCAFSYFHGFRFGWALDDEARKVVLPLISECLLRHDKDRYHKMIFAFSDEEVVYHRGAAAAMGFVEIMEPFISIKSSHKLRMTALTMTDEETEASAVDDYDRSQDYNDGWDEDDVPIEEEDEREDDENW